LVIVPIVPTACQSPVSYLSASTIGFPYFFIDVNSTM
jgi:hypothetical protein